MHMSNADAQVPSWVPVHDDAVWYLVSECHQGRQRQSIKLCLEIRKWDGCGRVRGIYTWTKSEVELGGVEIVWGEVTGEMGKMEEQ